MQSGEWRIEFIQNIDAARKKLVTEGRMFNGDKTSGLIQGEMTFLE